MSTRGRTGSVYFYLSYDFGIVPIIYFFVSVLTFDFLMAIPIRSRQFSVRVSETLSFSYVVKYTVTLGPFVFSVFVNDLFGYSKLKKGLTSLFMTILKYMITVLIMLMTGLLQTDILFSVKFIF